MGKTRNITQAKIPAIRRRLAQAKFVKPAASTSRLKVIREFYVKEGDVVFEVFCTAHKGVIAIESRVAGQKPQRGHKDGLLVAPVDGLCLSYRARPDGLMGYACLCGATDILMPEEQRYTGEGLDMPHVMAEVAEAVAARPEQWKPAKLFERRKVK